MSEPKNPSDDASKGTEAQATATQHANPTQTTEPPAKSKPDPPEIPHKSTLEPDDGGEQNGKSPTPAMEEKAMTMLERYAKTVTSILSQVEQRQLMALSSTQNTRNTIANVASQEVLPYLTAMDTMALGAQAKPLGPVKFLQSDIITGLESETQRAQLRKEQALTLAQS